MQLSGMCQSKILSSLLCRGKTCSVLLARVPMAQYSSDRADPRKFDPRTQDVVRILVPWKEKKEREKTNSVFSVFSSRSNLTDLLKLIYTPFDLRTDKIKSWWEKKRFEKDVAVQKFDQERLSAVGSDIAVAHALLPLGAGLQYKGKPWMKNTENSTPIVPDEFESGWVLEAIDLSGTRIRYEGLMNLHNLNMVHTLVAKNCPFLDDWCLDMISSELLGLETIDLSGCEKISARGLVTLTRLPKLCTVDLSDTPISKTHDGILVCMLLQDYNSNLNIKGVNFTELPEQELSNIA